MLRLRMEYTRSLLGSKGISWVLPSSLSMPKGRADSGTAGAVRGASRRKVEVCGGVVCGDVWCVEVCGVWRCVVCGGVWCVEMCGVWRCDDTKECIWPY